MFVSFTPGCIIENKELAMIKFSKLTEKLYDSKQISSKESDSRVQFEHFINGLAFLRSLKMLTRSKIKTKIKVKLSPYLMVKLIMKGALVSKKKSWLKIYVLSAYVPSPSFMIPSIFEVKVFIKLICQTN